MLKRILQVTIVTVFSLALMCASPNSIGNTVDTTIVVDYEIEDKLVALDEVSIEPKEEIIVTEPCEEPAQPSYFIEVNDGYITEDSLRSICTFVGGMYDISPNVLQAIAWNESNYYVYATGSCGDKGLCQIVSKWHGDRMARLGVYDIYDSYGNVLVCADILNDLKQGTYGTDIRYVIMAYNMGENNARRYYESGIISKYAQNVLEKISLLETNNQM